MIVHTIKASQKGQHCPNTVSCKSDNSFKLANLLWFLKGYPFYQPLQNHPIVQKFSKVVDVVNIMNLCRNEGIKMVNLVLGCRSCQESAKLVNNYGGCQNCKMVSSAKLSKLQNLLN